MIPDSKQLLKVLCVILLFLFISPSSKAQSATSFFKSVRTLNIPLSSANIPSSLKRIDLEISVAGRRFIQRFGAVPNLLYTFLWDGKDAYGRSIQGTQNVSIRIGYVYSAYYQYVARFGYFGNGILISASREVLEITLWQEQKANIQGYLDGRSQGFGAWTLNIHHFYDPTGQSLNLGYGDQRSATDMNKIITTVAGSATNAQFLYPPSATVDSQGVIFIADVNNNRIRKVSPDGIITTIAGNGTAGYSGDGGSATSASLNHPFDVAVDNIGNLFIADDYNHRIRKVDPDGIITTVVGSGIEGNGGDGGPATSASLNSPNSVAVDNQGNLFIADTYDSRIRKVSPDGIITTIAGNGTAGYSGDGGIATNAQIAWPYGVEVDSQGNLFIADYLYHRIRKVSPAGIITTLAGSGSGYSYSGDGGPATSAKLNNPVGVAVDSAGNLFIADSGNHSIRKVRTDGIITTVAGMGSYGYSGRWRSCN